MKHFENFQIASGCLSEQHFRVMLNWLTTEQLRELGRQYKIKLPQDKWGMVNRLVDAREKWQSNLSFKYELFEPYKSPHEGCDCNGPDHKRCGGDITERCTIIGVTLSVCRRHAKMIRVKGYKVERVRR